MSWADGEELMEAIVEDIARHGKSGRPGIDWRALSSGYVLRRHGRSLGVVDRREVRYAITCFERPDWVTEPMPSGVPHQLVERGGRR